MALANVMCDRTGSFTPPLSCFVNSELFRIATVARGISTYLKPFGPPLSVRCDGPTLLGLATELAP